MRTNKLHKQADADAAEYAGAYMAVGEGAGNRRKLIEGTVGYKSEFVPGYREAFEAAHSKQDMAKHAEQARKENRRRERSQSTERNAKAIISGDMKNADLKIIALVGGLALAHKTGFDLKVVNFVKREARDFKAGFKKSYAKNKAKVAEANSDGVYNITDA